MCQKYEEKLEHVALFCLSYEPNVLDIVLGNIQTVYLGQNINDK